MLNGIKDIKHSLGSKAPTLAICGICKDQTIDTVMPDCGHVMCENCSHSLTSDEDDDGCICPFCNEPSFYPQKLYGIQA
ncbi:MAG: hypothetical protein EOP45_14180 [Sphingobacteriaceae bacterium]|nr:MAG: hypothetical protein EOP45_14180 [Sphingobacteriaceae bacterium]